MANEAYVYRIRTDLNDGAHQITDLLPNTSRRAFSYQVHPQSGYLPPRVTNDAVTGAANPTTAALSGLAAYILDVTNDESSGFQIAVADADTAAAAIIALADAGSPVDEAALLAIFVTTVGMGNGTMPYPSQLALSVTASPPGASAAGALNVNGATSVGTQAGLMQALCGGAYTLPVGSTVNAAAVTAQEGSFDGDGWRQMYQSGAFTISATAGDIAHYADATYTYVAVTGAAAVAYALDGTVIS